MEPALDLERPMGTTDAAPMALEATQPAATPTPSDAGSTLHQANATDAAPYWRVRVLLNEPVGLLDYHVPPELHSQLHSGMAVRVPLGKRRTSAYVHSVVAGPHPDGIALKDLQGLDHERPPLPAAVMELVLFAAHYYGVAPGEMLSVALPSLARPATARYRHNVHFKPAKPLSAAQRALWELAQQHPKGFTVAAVERTLQLSRAAAAARLRTACDAGMLERAVKRPSARQQILYERVPSGDVRVLPKQSHAAAALLEHIPIAGITLRALCARDPHAKTRIRTLVKAGLVRRRSEAVQHNPFVMPTLDRCEVVPTADQATVIAALVQALQTGCFTPVLLHGVTGSGKTEVYLQTIAHALSRGRSALVLVPEIALTPQLGDRFRRRFGERVATFHSGLTPAERRDEWERVARGDATIGLGARSALFLPLRDVGVIIVDEEHETSFKQDEAPRYHARDLAVYRARLEQALVVLGSATPSLETHYNACAKRYRRLVLPSRVAGRPLPEVECIPLAGAPRVGEGVFTERLARATERALALGEQVILFLNRRGFAPYVFCSDCGHSYRCESCDVSLTLHRRRGVLMCHYCGFEMVAPDTCAGCHGHRVGAFGLGTERVQAEVRSLFGSIPALRLDRDVVRNKIELERVLGRFRAREAQLLIGTQMVAKGHDFPGVTLVGVISADASLNFPDFRAAERTFQLLTQVAGRAGRGEQRGFVLVQAYEADHYSIRCAQTHDFAQFVELELQTRRELGYPPFTHLALVRFEGPSEAHTQAAAASCATVLQQGVQHAGLPVMVLGPAAAPLARLREQWRFVILLKAQSRQALRHALTHLHKRPTGEVRRILDVDPVSML